jgi:hypothetical protein
MNPETRRAIEAALLTPQFAGVRAALEATVKEARNLASEGRFKAAACWENDRWQAAWREMMPGPSVAEKGIIGDVLWLASTNTTGPVFVVDTDGPASVKLTGDELADTLRDIALGWRNDD